MYFFYQLPLLCCYLEGSKKNFWDPYNPELYNAGETTGLTSSVSEYRIEGYLSRAEYNYKDKYYGSASFRRDGSSKLSPGVRWGNFWSVGGAWRLKEEDEEDSEVAESDRYWEVSSEKSEDERDERSESIN